MLGGEILPFYEHVFYLTCGIRRGRIFIASSQAYMLELKNRFEFVAVFSANAANAFGVRLTLAHGEKAFYFFASEELSDIFVQARSVVHFVVREIFGNEIEHVASEPVYAEICPKIHYIATLLSYFRVFPVEVGLLHGKRVQVVFVGCRVVFPRAAAKTCRPVGKRLVRPDIIIVIGVIFRLSRLFKSIMLGRGVIDDQIHYYLNAVFMQLFRQSFPVVERAELVHDIAVVGDIVTVVVIRAFVAGAYPYRVYAEVFEIGYFLFYSVKIAYSVAVRVVKTARVNLIND